MSHGVAAFHESFGDMSAILVALQQPAVRKEVLAETGGSLYRSSRLSRVAEQLGWASAAPACAAGPDALRNAVNCFAYQRPTTLPVTAPAVLRSSLPHSVPRVFTGGFSRMYSGMVLLLNRPPSSNDLLQAAKDAGRLVIAAVRAAPVVPDYFAQVAAHLLEADAQLFDGRYAPAIQFGMAGRGNPLLAVGPGRSHLAGADAGRRCRPRRRRLPLSAFGGAEFGLDRPVLMRVPG